MIWIISKSVAYLHWNLISTRLLLNLLLPSRSCIVPLSFLLFRYSALCGGNQNPMYLGAELVGFRTEQNWTCWHCLANKLTYDTRFQNVGQICPYIFVRHTKVIVMTLHCSHGLQLCAGFKSSFQLDKASTTWFSTWSPRQTKHLSTSVAKQTSCIQIDSKY